MKTYYVYKATNKLNGKSYIGQTSDFHKRVWQHIRCYEKEDCKFHRAIKKYGVEAFSWEILKQCTSDKESLELERFYIEFYNTYRNGYNENKGGVGGHNAKSIVMLTKEGEFVKRYDSAADAKCDGFSDSNVLMCCKKEHRQQLCKGYRFMFEDEYLENGAEPYIEIPKIVHTKKVVQCDLQGNFIAEYESVQEASEKTGTHRPSLSLNLSKRYKSANGFIFVYADEYPIKDMNEYEVKRKGKKIFQLDKVSGEILNEYDSIADAGRALGKNYKAIHKVLDDENKTAYGFKWISRYANTEVND